jgi:hypothetical protein
MIKIAHRGNIYGQNTKDENNPDYIMDALSNGYHAEVDVWFVGGQWYLGHDNPQYSISKDFLLNPMLWCHAKNKESLFNMRKMMGIHFFWHQDDDYTLTSKGYVWTYPGKDTMDGSIIVCGKDLPDGFFSGICSDYVGYF